MLSTTFLQPLAKELASKFEGSKNTTTCTFDVQSHDNPSFSFPNVTVSQVLKQLKKLDVNKATVSLRTGIVSSNWKISRVTPFFKDGPRTEVGNYRPISVIPVVIKLLERIVHDQFHDSFHLS